MTRPDPRPDPRRYQKYVVADVMDLDSRLQRLNNDGYRVIAMVTVEGDDSIHLIAERMDER